jgi:hypothetical protein
MRTPTRLIALALSVILLRPALSGAAAPTDADGTVRPAHERTVLINGGNGAAGDVDFVERVKRTIPAGWKVEVSGFDGKCFVEISTAPIDTQASRYGSGNPRISKGRLGVRIQILARYAPEMLKAIREHNESIRMKLKEFPPPGKRPESDEERELLRELIDEPMFTNATYGFVVAYPTRVPKRAGDAEKLMEVVQRLTTDWESSNPDKPNVLDELRRILIQYRLRRGSDGP